MMVKKNHPFHLVDMSPWPILASFGSLVITSGFVKWFSFGDKSLFFMGLFLLFLVSFQWWRDITRESTFQGLHTESVLVGMKLGMLLFIISEVFFFFSFFWAFFHSSLSPTFEIGMIWPPLNIIPFNPLQIPLLNTVILLSSGVSVTWAHHSLINSEYSESTKSLLITILLGMYFTLLQGVEYWDSSFTITDSVYGSCFFMATGFHGLHVIIGTMFLVVCLVRLINCHFSMLHHFGFEAAAWYWHFVDVVWLFLYLNVYWWGA